MFHIIDTQSISDVRQCSVGCIEERICTCVILRSYPFSLQDSPKRFCNVQVWGIWWKEKQKKSSVFPYRSEFLNQLVPMHCSIVELVAGNHAENVESCDPLGRNEHVLSFQLPTVWYISFRTGVAFIGIIECNVAFICLSFKFLQLLGLVFIELRRGYSLGRFLIRLYLAPMLIKNV